MSLRPRQARWFETYTPRDQTVHATEVLARTGLVELEADTPVVDRVDEQRLHYFVERFRALAAEHARDLPPAGRQASSLEGDPIHLANQALHRLRTWSARVDYVRAHLEHLQAELEHLRLLGECVEAMRRAGLDLEAMFRRTHFLCKCLFACPKGKPFPTDALPGVEEVIEGELHDFFYVAGMQDTRQLISEAVVELGCQPIGVPAWLRGDAAQQKLAVSTRVEAVEAEMVEMQAELKELHDDAAIASDRANVDTLHWYLRHAAGSLGSGEYCHLTGWTTARDVRDLQRVLQAAGIHAVMRFPAPPADAQAPVSTVESWWAQPFQSFTALWGTPGRREIDPTGILALVVPLLFGYMFPDVGHGLLLVLFAAVNYRRWPRIRFLLPCGLSAMAFGVVFGDAFGFHLERPLWLRPLEEPLPVLVIPMLFGVLLMLLGMVFAGVEARWSGELRRWLRADFAVLLIYVTAIIGLLLPQAFWLTALAALHYLAGSASLAPGGRRLAALPGALGALLLSVFELVMNTLSFLRVGAFALAHAALSSAVMTLAGAVESLWAQALIVVAGNLFALVLEGLLVFVQTTRLVLFEFFIRFLRAEGRLFRPVHGPQSAAAPRSAGERSRATSGPGGQASS
jgi:V/A-type H+-transporting ATPase subunit I